MKRPSGSAVAVIVALLVLVLPVLYVLSAGPAVWLHSNGWLDGDRAAFFYRPLDWCLSRSPEWITEALRGYTNLWRSWPPDPPEIEPAPASSS